MGARRRTCVAIAVTICVLPAVARADDLTAEQRETGRFLMKEGRELRDKKNDLKGALDKFIQADAVVHHVPTSGLELARTYDMRSE